MTRSKLESLNLKTRIRQKLAKGKSDRSIAKEEGLSTAYVWSIKTGKRK